MCGSCAVTGKIRDRAARAYDALFRIDGRGGSAIPINHLQRLEAESAERPGFAAWLRTPAQCGGCWPFHIHAVAIGDPDLWQRDGGFTNRDQVADYYVGRNGLSSHAADNTPNAYRVPFTWWEWVTN